MIQGCARLWPALALLGLLAWVPTAVAEDEPDDGATVRALLEKMAGPPENWDVRDELIAMGATRVVPHLRLASLPPGLRYAALDVLRELGKGEALYRITLEGMRDPDTNLRGDAIQILVDALEEGRTSFQQAWWRDLLLAFHGTKVVVIRTFYSGPGYPSWNLEDMVLTPQVHGSEATLLELTRDDDWRVRMMATFFLGKTRLVRTNEVEQAIAARLTDEHPTVRHAAVQTACRFNWLGILDAVGTRLDDPDEDEAVRVDAAQYLPDFDPDRAIPYLLRALESPSPAIRRAAAESAYYLTWSPKVVARLLDRLGDDVAEVRHEAARAVRGRICHPLFEQGPPIDEPTLLERLEDPDPLVAAAALAVLTSRNRVDASAVPRLIAWLGSEHGQHVATAARALVSLRGAGTPALEALRAAPGEGRVAYAVRWAIESIEMAALPPEDLDMRLADPDLEVCLPAMREVVRRGDRARLVKGLDHAGAGVALEAADALREDPTHTEACVQAALRAVGAGVKYKPHGLLYRLGDRIRPHAPLLILTFRSDPDAYFHTLAGLEPLRQDLAEAVWADLVVTSHAQPTERASQQLGLLHPEVRAALKDGPARLRERALRVLELSRDWQVWPFFEDLEALRDAHPEDGLLQDRVRLLIRDKAIRPRAGNIGLR